MKQTPSQTVGPYFAYGLTPEQYRYNFTQLADNQLVEPQDSPECIQIMGQVFDGEGQTIPDAMVEIWDHQNQLFGRFGTGTDAQHRFHFDCLKPTGDAPYLNVILFMRGQLIHSYTRIYFADENNENDPVFMSIPDGRANTLLAQKINNHYVFNIYMQGDNETVFFEV